MGNRGVLIRNFKFKLCHSTLCHFDRRPYIHTGYIPGPMPIRPFHDHLTPNPSVHSIKKQLSATCRKHKHHEVQISISGVHQMYKNQGRKSKVCFPKNTPSRKKSKVRLSGSCTSQFEKRKIGDKIRYFQAERQGMSGPSVTARCVEDMLDLQSAVNDRKQIASIGLATECRFCINEPCSLQALFDLHPLELRRWLWRITRPIGDFRRLSFRGHRINTTNTEI